MFSQINVVAVTSQRDLLGASSFSLHDLLTILLVSPVLILCKTLCEISAPPQRTSAVFAVHCFEFDIEILERQKNKHRTKSVGRPSEQDSTAQNSLIATDFQLHETCKPPLLS